MIPVASYAAATDDQLLTELATLVKDLQGDARAGTWPNSTCSGPPSIGPHGPTLWELVTGRNRISDEFVKDVDQERIGIQAQVAVLEDQAALVRTILDYRTAHGDATGR